MYKERFVYLKAIKMVTVGLVFLVSQIACLRLDYEDFEEVQGKGTREFQIDYEICDLTAEAKSSRPEGSQRTGQVMLERRKNVINCMDKRGWELKN